jgi:sRNA-binding regulator protein Hfq
VKGKQDKMYTFILRKENRTKIHVYFVEGKQAKGYIFVL